MVELRVIAVTDKKLPSEVAYKRYELKENLRPKDVRPEEGRIIAPNALSWIQENKSDAASSAGGLNALPSGSDVLQSGGADSVQASPDLADDCGFFGEL